MDITDFGFAQDSLGLVSDQSVKERKMNDKDLKELCNKLCEQAPESMAKLIAELEGVRGLQHPLIFNFICACRESEFLGDECGE